MQSYAGKSTKLDIGLAIGLFAIFGIIRYRTESIPIREMTYLFITIGISLMNAMTNKKLSYEEILFANVAVIFLLNLIEKLWKLRFLDTQIVLYEKLKYKTQNRELLITDLEERTGLKVVKLEIKDIDFVKDAANIVIYYHPEKIYELN
ncbi:MAG: DUF4956 domain-containing protein [Polaribacter sp.]|nr:DUF4956 domain-containing protein [Polaribacter sp.]